MVKVDGKNIEAMNTVQEGFTVRELQVVLEHMLAVGEAQPHSVVRLEPRRIGDPLNTAHCSMEGTVILASH